MKLKQSVNLLLIALFVWAFQSSTIHFQHHEIEEIAECSVCHASEQLDLSHHNSPALVIQENIAVKIRKDVEKVVIALAFDYTDVPQLKYINIIANQYYSLGSTPLGFNATAPPYPFSS